MVLLFLSSLLALGFSARLRDHSVLQYLASGRALSLPAFVATLVSTWYGGILGVAESVTYYGAGAWTLIGLPYYAFGLVYAAWVAGRVRAADQISIPERMHARWGAATAMTAAALLFLLAVPAAHVLMLGTLAQLATGWDLRLATAAAAAVGTLFLYRGGLLADVRASLLAFLMMYVGFGIILGWCWSRLPFADLWASLPPERKDWTGGGGPLQAASFFILGAWTLVDPAFHQRAASAASPRVARAGLVVSVFCWMLFDLLSIGTALYATAAGPAPANVLAIYPLFGQRVLPPGLFGLFLCGIAGTVLVAMVGYTLVAGATLGRELLARARRVTDERRVKNLTRAGMAAATALAVVVGLNIPSVVALWYAWGGCVVGALLIPTLMAYGRGAAPEGPQSRLPAWISASMVASFAVSFAWLVYGQATGNPFLEVGWVSGGAGVRLVLPPFPEDAPVARLGVGTLLPGLVISALVLALGRLATRKQPR